MLEIFIPTLIKNQKISINTISNNFLNAIKILNWKITNFQSTFFSGIKINLDNFDEDLILLCNWEFWEHYFIDFDFTKKINTDIFWIKIVWKNKIWENIQEIMLNIAEITWILSSDKLLTNSKKEDILLKIKNSFFSLSGVIFLLYSLKKKTEKNLEELNNYSWKIEYEAQARLLKENSLTKNIELKANIDKLEGKIEMFISVINKLI